MKPVFYEQSDSGEFCNMAGKRLLRPCAIGLARVDGGLRAQTIDDADEAVSFKIFVGLRRDPGDQRQHGLVPAIVAGVVFKREAFVARGRAPEGDPFFCL